MKTILTISIIENIAQLVYYIWEISPLIKTVNNFLKEKKAMEGKTDE